MVSYVSLLHMHLSHDRFQLFFGNSHEFALIQVKCIFLISCFLPQVLVSRWKWFSMFMNPVERRNFGYLNVFLHHHGNWHVDNLVGSPSLDSVLRHHLRHFLQLFYHLHGILENLVLGTLQNLVFA